MPPKRRLEKKRKRHEHPKVERWFKISALATQIGKLTKQVVQYRALLKQIIDITRHDQEHPENTWAPQTLSKTLEKDIYDFIQTWLKDVQQNSKDIQQTRDSALKTLRTVDVLDDQALKSTALVLAETEFQCVAMEQIAHRWNKIVRHDDDSSVIEHTQQWILRWLKQWNHTNTQLVHTQKFFDDELNNSVLKD